MAEKPNIVGGVDISRKYPIEEIMRMHARGMLRPIAVHGYIVRADADGMVGFVPYTESTLFNMGAGHTDERGIQHLRGGRTYQSKGDMAETMRQEVERENPMVRRAAQEKRVSLVKRLLGTARLAGTVPGLTDAQISTMIGETWVTGVSVVTAEMLDRVAQHLLGQGERSNKEADSKRTTRAHALA